MPPGAAHRPTEWGAPRPRFAERGALRAHPVEMRARARYVIILVAAHGLPYAATAVMTVHQQGKGALMHGRQLYIWLVLYAMLLH